tara:strand:+ start:463 stop:1047 length:585 start_codon:yes stop_codon:yes gene_type:complete
MPKMWELRELSAQIDQEYTLMTNVFGAYQSSTKLSCPPLCGKCCNNPDIEATPIELLPLALELYDQGRLDEDFLKHLDQLDLCFSYRPKDGQPNLGQCQFYQQRPSVCRMFGIAGYRNKSNEIQLSTCSILKEQNGENYQKALENKNQAPVIGKWSTRVNVLEPTLGQRYYKLNLALKIIAQKILVLASYDQSN